MDISSAFESLVNVFNMIIHSMQTHGITLFGTYYSFFNIELAILLGGFVLSHLPIWGDSEFDDIGDDN